MIHHQRSRTQLFRVLSYSTKRTCLVTLDVKILSKYLNTYYKTKYRYIRVKRTVLNICLSCWSRVQRSSANNLKKCKIKLRRRRKDMLVRYRDIKNKIWSSKRTLTSWKQSLRKWKCTNNRITPKRRNLKHPWIVAIKLWLKSRTSRRRTRTCLQTTTSCEARTTSSPWTTDALNLRSMNWTAASIIWKWKYSTSMKRLKKSNKCQNLKMQIPQRCATLHS